MGNCCFKELRVWQKGKDLAVYIYQITNVRLCLFRVTLAKGDERERDEQIKRLFGTITLLKGHLLKY